MGGLEDRVKGYGRQKVYYEPGSKKRNDYCGLTMLATVHIIVG